MSNVIDWIFDHLFIVLIVGGAIAQWLQKRRAGGAEATPEAESMDRSQQDPEEGQRTRRIQEEIRRKIAERRGELTGTPRRESYREEPPPVPVRTSARVDEQAEEELGRQRRLAEQLALLEVRQTEARRQDRAVWSGTKTAIATMPTGASGPASTEGSLARALRTKSALRRGVILAEVLGKPRGLA